MEKIDKGLTLNVLKGALGADDFGILGTSDGGEIESMADLETAVTPPNATTTTNTTAKETDTEIGGIEEIEGDLPVDDTEDTTNTQKPSVSSANNPADNPADNPANKAAKPDLLKIFGENLSEKGVLAFDPVEFDKAEDKEAFLYKGVEDTINKKAEDKFNEKYSELPPEIDRLIELHKEGVPLHKVLEADERVATLEGIKTEEIESTPDLQKEIIRELLGSQGISSDKIEAKIKRFEDLGILKDEAIDGFDSLLANEKKQRAEMIKAEKAKEDQAVTDRQNRLKEIETNINSKEEILPGFKLTPEDKKTLVEGITKIVGKDKQGRPINGLAKARLEDPDMDLKVAYFTLVMKGDLNKLKKAETTKATRSLKSVLDSQEPITGASQRAEGGLAGKPDLDIIKRSLSALRRA